MFRSPISEELDISWGSFLPSVCNFVQTSEPIKDFKAMAGRRPQIVIFKLDDTFSFGDDYH